MNPFAFYLLAALLVGLSALLVWETSPYSLAGASEYEKKKMRRLAGTILFLAASLCLGIGLIMQLSLANP